MRDDLTRFRAVIVARARERRDCAGSPNRDLGWYRTTPRLAPLSYLRWIARTCTAIRRLEQGGLDAAIHAAARSDDAIDSVVGSRPPVDCWAASIVSRKEASGASHTAPPSGNVRPICVIEAYLVTDDPAASADKGDAAALPSTATENALRWQCFSSSTLARCYASTGALRATGQYARHRDIARCAENRCYPSRVDDSGNTSCLPSGGHQWYDRDRSQKRPSPST